MSSRLGHRTRGFTLVEMLVVLVLLALLAGSIVASLEGRAELHAIRTLSKDIAAAARFAAQEARLSGQPHRLVVDQLTRRYWVERVTAQASDTFEKATGLAGIAKSLPKGSVVATVSSEGLPVTAIAGRNLVEFLPTGGFDGALIIKSEDGQLIEIRIASQTGQVHVVE